MLDAITASQIAMLQDQYRLQSINQNISNMQTPGYKKHKLDGVGFDEQIQANTTQVLQQMHESLFFDQGVMTKTQNNHNLALTGDGFFTIQTNQGLFYTRRGDFIVNSEGALATQSNGIVIGKNGPIQVNDQSFTIDPQGNILIDGEKIGQLNLVSFQNPNQLKYLGEGLYASTEPYQPITNNTQVKQGFIENSNVKSIDEMMELIQTARHYEASQRVMRTANHILSTAINQLGESNV